MTMQEFYKKYHLNKYNFAEIAGVGTGTLIKYAAGEPIREDSKERIERAVQIAINHNLVRPIRTGGFDSTVYSIRLRNEQEYIKTFKELIKEES